MDYSVHYSMSLSNGFGVSRAIQREGVGVSFLYDLYGNRKYLTLAERQAFLAMAKQEVRPEVRTFCATLAYTGARISEVLALAPRRIDLATNTLVIESLKKRRAGVYRAIPVPSSLLAELNDVHGIQRFQQDPNQTVQRIWPWGRTTAWKVVSGLMRQAGIRGPQATPKGLRHGFAVVALQSGAPLNMVSKWLGHARLSTTAIYTDVTGEEERSFAEKLWRTF